MIDNILDQLARDEGFKDTPYKDTRGFSTVGYGHNLDAHPLLNEVYPMAQARAKEILQADLAVIDAKLYHDLPWVSDLADVYKGVLQNLSFNMGVEGLLEFKNTLALIHTGEYPQAAKELLNSLWAKQVGNRAVRVATQLRTNQWV